MASLIDIKVPDIGDFKDVPIIEVLVKPGDRVKTEDPLITLESDKASMEVPSPVDGVVKELKVKVGDKVSEGSLILIAEAEVAPAGTAPREKVKGGGYSTGEGAPVADYGAAAGVYEIIEVRVPDIGDFKDVPVIEVAVKSGDKVKPEDPLITLESDKASMEVPSPAAGTVKEVKVKIGDKVGEGSLILTLETGVTHAAPAAPAARRVTGAAPAAPMPTAARHAGDSRPRMRHARSGRRPRRLLGRVPLRRSRHDHGARGALPDARRRLPQCRLHPVQGAAAYRVRDGRGERDGGARDQLFGTADRSRHAAHSQGEGRRQD